jgi:RNA polymerase sigma-70 factor, ECF subfamily
MTDIGPAVGSGRTAWLQASGLAARDDAGGGERRQMDSPRRPVAAVIAVASAFDRASDEPARSETALVERASRGDRDAFGQLVSRRLESSFRTALAIVGNESDARDIIQDVFLTAWRELPRVRDHDHFDAWLGRVLVNTCRSHLRRRRRITIRELPVDSFAAETQLAKPPADRPFDDRTAALDAIERAFNRLSVGDRTLLVLHHGDHRQLSEIAFSLGIPVGTVKSRLHAARQSLERAMEVESR